MTAFFVDSLDVSQILSQILFTKNENQTVGIKVCCAVVILEHEI